jgi:hypothetical protein
VKVATREVFNDGAMEHPIGKTIAHHVIQAKAATLRPH